jgi:hypothetical protein
MNTINLQRKCGKINDRVLYPAAHNGLVAGSMSDNPCSPERYAQGAGKKTL